MLEDWVGGFWSNVILLWYVHGGFCYVSSHEKKRRWFIIALSLRFGKNPRFLVSIFSKGAENYEIVFGINRVREKSSTE